MKLSAGLVRRSLRHRNYRLFFVGQGTSLIGTWLTRVALGWWVYRLTGSELMLGAVAFAGQIPTFLLAPLGGVLSDRYDRHRMLVITQVLGMVQSGLLALLAFSTWARIEYILGLAVFQGLINAFDTPARQAFLVEIVEAREDLPNAIALNSSMVNGARLIGPSFAGVLIALFGEAGCFAIDAVSYIAVLGSLFLMRVRRHARPVRTSRVFTELAAGLNYARRSQPIRAVLLLVSLVSLMGAPYSVLMPVFAAQLLGGGPSTLGFLMAAAGAGAVAGGLWLASRPNVLGLGRSIAFAALAFGVALVAFSFSRMLSLSLLLMVIAGAGMMVQMAGSNTILQTIVEEDKRGRVMSLYTMAFFGMMPFGSLMAGWFAARFGAPTTLLVGGIITALGGLVFMARLPALHLEMRPRYVELGILPKPSASATKS